MVMKGRIRIQRVRRSKHEKSMVVASSKCSKQVWDFDYCGECILL